jgi:Zn-dependent protease with chaperone function
MDVTYALDELTPFLPAGARWFPLAVWLFAGLVIGPIAVGAGLWLAGRPLRRRQRSEAEMHWTERARLGYPLLAVSRGGGVILPIILFATPAIWRNAFSAVPAFVLSAALMAALYLSALFVRRRATRGLSEIPLTYWETARGEWLGLVLLTPQLFVMFAMSFSIGVPLDELDVVQSLVGVAAFALICRSAGLPFVRLLGAVRRAEPPLTQIVDAIARTAGVRVRRVWVVDWPCVNALALPWSRQLVYTKELLARFDHEEIAAFTAHELGHLSESTSVKMMRSLGALALLPLGFTAPIVGRYGMSGLAVVIVVVYVVLFAAVHVARRMEHRADGVAHTHDLSEGTYARALEKAYRANGFPAVMPQKRPVHPHLYDRLTAAGVVPDYPRPAPPSRGRAFAGSSFSAVIAVLGIATVVGAPLTALREATDPDRATLWAVVLGDADAAADLGVRHAGDEDPARAIAWLGLAHALDAGDHDSGAYAAELLAYGGRCGRARELLDEAERRAAESGDQDCDWIQDARDALLQCETATRPRDA